MICTQELKLNKTKTEALLIGSSKHNLHACIASIKCATMVKALGVYFGHDKKECEHLNWEDKIKSYINCYSINNWNKRNLTFIGKINVIKTLLLSRFTYLFQTCFTSKDIVSRINKIFYGFLRSNKRE